VKQRIEDAPPGDPWFARLSARIEAREEAKRKAWTIEQAMQHDPSAKYILERVRVFRERELPRWQKALDSALFSPEAQRFMARKIDGFVSTLTALRDRLTEEGTK
jgi:hypothetical protein